MKAGDIFLQAISRLMEESRTYQEYNWPVGSEAAQKGIQGAWRDGYLRALKDIEAGRVTTPDVLPFEEAHKPLRSLSGGQITQCACGWVRPSNAFDEVAAFAAHVEASKAMRKGSR